MGSSSSRPGSRHPRTTPRPKRSRLLSVFVCGGASASRSPTLEQMDNDPAELLVNSFQRRKPLLGKFQRSKKDSVLVSETEPRFSSPKIEQAASSESDIEATQDSPVEYSSVIDETNNNGKGLSQSNDRMSPHQLSSGHRSSDIASTSYEVRPPLDMISAIGRDNLDAVSHNDSIIDRDVSQGCSSVTQRRIPSLHELVDSCSDGVSIENHASELNTMHDSDSASASTVSDSPVNFNMQRNENLQDERASGLGFVVSDGEQGQRDESLLHLDVLGFSPNTLSNSSADNSSHEARRNSRRLFWDAFSRRSSRRHSDSRTLVFASNESDDLGSHDRWLFDFNGDYSDDGLGGDTGALGSRTHSLNEHHWHSSSEIWERLRSGRRGSGRRSNFCPSGRHPNGTCACESVITADESGTHASISRIVMLAEALFEVLDEIHRQPVALSLSMVSLPASESIVDALPVKSHRKTLKSPVADDDDEQCYICLAEYEEGDKIRVLPCHHEYHMLCVDKWLKEIHGVCPLCRGDVREIDASMSNTEIPSIS